MENNYNNTSKPYTVKIPTNNKKELKNPSVSMPIDLNQNSIRNPFIIPGLKKVNVESQLNSNYSFENLVEGDCNRLARSAGFAVANKPGGTAFNPLLIYGGVGLGKTHLSHAIGIQIKNEFPNKTVLYVSSEKFTQQYIDSVRNNNQNDFVHFYQMIDVLIIDDVQYFAGKEKTQDVFFHIFNHLHQTGKQLVLTADKAPVELQGFEQRLLSRFKWGLAADLRTPGLETRIAILEKKVYADGLDLPKEVIEYLAYSITTNVRELEGALISLLAQSSMNKKAITLELVETDDRSSSSPSSSFARSPTFLMPRSWRCFSMTLPTPGISRTSSGARNFASSPGTIHSTPLGLACAEETLAISRDDPMPTEQLSWVCDLHALVQRVGSLQRRSVQAGGARHVEIGLVNRCHLHQRRKRSQHSEDFFRALAVAFGMSVDENCLGTHLGRGAQRHGGVHAKLPRRIGSGRNDAALVPLPAHDYWLAFQRGVVELFHGDEEGVHVDVEDGARKGGLLGGSHDGGILAAAVRPGLHHFTPAA